MEQINRYGTYEEYRAALREELSGQAESFVRTGYLLRLAQETDILQGSGYVNVVEFAGKEFGLDKSQVSRYIAINEEYSEGGFSERLQERYQGYGYAKLALMLMLPGEIRGEISANFSKSEIQAVKDELDAEKRTTDIELLIEGELPEQADMGNLEKAIHQMGRDNPDLFRRLWDCAHGKADVRWTDREMENLFDIMAPQGESIYSVRIQGAGRLQLSCKGLDRPVVLISLRTMEKEEHTWEEIAHILSGELMVHTSVEESWQQLYGEEYPCKKSPVAPVQQASKKPEARKQSKVTKAPVKPPQKQQRPVADIQEQKTMEVEQLPGQETIEEDFPNVLPSPVEGDTRNGEDAASGSPEAPDDETDDGEDEEEDDGEDEGQDEMLTVEGLVDRMGDSLDTIKLIYEGMTAGAYIEVLPERIEKLHEAAKTFANDVERLLQTCHGSRT